MTIARKVVISICSIAALLLSGYLIVIASFSFIFGSSYGEKDLVDNYIKREYQVKEAKRYFNSIVPANKRVEIEFESSRKLFRFGVYDVTATNKYIAPTTFLYWDLDVNSFKVDSVIASLGWTHKTLQTLKQKLDDAHCIQIESGEPTQIGFQRSGLGMYYYNVFSNRITDSAKQGYADQCAYKYYNDELILEYGGGAVGPQCFPQDDTEPTH